ncbi:MAG TPA: adenylate/guanylate cyclase domain-containing protein [Bacillota bacterium]|nr:adenylate/guanylate cyclase domain-containing protein [Bacillota bacterium]
MHCFNCGILIPSLTVTECRFCGARFSYTCSACHSPNPMMAQFCLNCGIPIHPTSTQSSVHNFETLDEGRQDVAVIFADLSGFTSMAEKMDPEEVREMVNECFCYITQPVYELEGTIDKYIGDCVMVLFGAKYAHGDDCYRAVLCALRMMELIKEFSKERFYKHSFPLNLSIGINYGLVVTGSVGNDFDHDFTVMGDVVNTAQRLQSLAGVGEVLVSTQVYEETKEQFLYSTAKKAMVKHKEKPVDYYRVTGIVEQSPEKTHLIGRSRELEQILTIDRGARKGASASFILLGEPGMGKTQVLKEFAARLGPGRKQIWIECNALLQQKAYYTLNKMIYGILNLRTEENRIVKQHRLLSFLDFIMSGAHPDERRMTLGYLGYILGLDQEAEFRSILTATRLEDIQVELRRQVRIFFERLGAQQQLVIFIDDLHWADLNSLLILEDLVSHLPKGILLAMGAWSLPEALNSLVETRMARLPLQTFSEKETGQLIRQITHCRKADSHLVTTVKQSTHGNPLFIKAYLASLQRLKKLYYQDHRLCLNLEGSQTIPTNIQKLILSNLQTLDETAFHFLQTASVVGRDFPLHLVNHLLNLPPDEEQTVHHLIQMNIIAVKSVTTTSGRVEKILGFNYELERTAIYDSILHRRQSEIHGQIAHYIENQAADSEDHYEILSYHYQRSGQTQKAVENSYRAATKCMEDFKFPNAIRYFQLFLELTEETASVVADPRTVQVYLVLGNIHWMISDYKHALSYIDHALPYVKSKEELFTAQITIAKIRKELAEYEKTLEIIAELETKLRPDNRQFGELLQLKCAVLRIKGDPNALSTAKRSEKILLQNKDYLNLSETMNQAGIIYYNKGDIHNSLFYLEKSLKYAERANHLALIARVAGNMGIIHHATGNISRAEELFQRSIQLARTTANRQVYTSGSINLGILYLDKGRFEQAETLFQTALSIARELSHRLYECTCLINIGDIFFERGDNPKALQYYQDSLVIARDRDLTVEEGINELALIRLEMRQLEFTQLPERFSRAFVVFQEAGEVSYLCDYYRFHAIYHFYQNSFEQAMADCEEAIRNAEIDHNDLKKTRALRLKSFLLLQKGEDCQAQTLLDQVILLAEQLESDYEAAKGYYLRSLSYPSTGYDDKRSTDRQKSFELMEQVDPCWWSEFLVTSEEQSPSPIEI